MIYNHREINIGQEAKAEAQNTGKSWENGHPEAWDGCGYPRTEVRPRHSRDQQTLSLGQDIAKDVRTPGARPQPWRLRSEVGCGHPPALELDLANMVQGLLYSHPLLLHPTFSRSKIPVPPPSSFCPGLGLVLVGELQGP